MPEYLDVANWARRDLFEFFRGFDKPYFNICARIDITELLTLVRRSNSSVSLAYHYFALRVANEIEPFRYRLREGKVLVHDVIHGATIVLLPNESFTFAHFAYQESFEKFVAGAARALKEAQSVDHVFRPWGSDDNVIHFTTLPWISFTSFSHARNWGREDSVPKIAFGKFIKESERILLPISIEVHHALMDGLHVGRYLTRLEEALGKPEDYTKANKV